MQVGATSSTRNSLIFLYVVLVLGILFLITADGHGGRSFTSRNSTYNIITTSSKQGISSGLFNGLSSVSTNSSDIPINISKIIFQSFSERFCCCECT